MPKVFFTYDQHVTQTFRASCTVPEGAEDWDESRLIQHVSEHPEDWTENGEAIDTEYGDIFRDNAFNIEDVEDDDIP